MSEAAQQSKLYQAVKLLQPEAWPQGLTFNHACLWGDWLWCYQGRGIPESIAALAFEASTAEFLLRQDHVVKVWSPVDRISDGKRFPEAYIVALDDEDVDAAQMAPTKIEALVAKCREVK